MKALCLGLFVSLLWLLGAQPVYAQLPPTPIQPTASPSAAQTTKSDASDTISTIKKFVTSTDTLLGGFIFYTPDIFADSIQLKDGTVLPGLATFRNIFYTISIPVVAIAIAYFALHRLRDETPYAYKALLTKLLMVAILFIITPPLLSYSIQANNLLVKKITSEQNFSQFITSFLDNEQEQIQKGADPQEFGIPNTRPVFLGGIMQSLWQFLLQSALFLIALFFFVIGFLFIAFQFIIRFASLLFLSVLFPIAIPFALSEKTEGITNMYFKTWFTFLIHQPAFALGYMLATGFLSAILATNGASLGMLFFYSGFLFFLGGVNTLVSSVFGSSWTAIGSNIGASMLAAPVGSSFNEFKRGAMGGKVTGIRSLTGHEMRKHVGKGFVTVKSRWSQLSRPATSNKTSGKQNGKTYVEREDLDELIKTATPVQNRAAQKSKRVKVTTQQNGAGHLQQQESTPVNPQTRLKNKQMPQEDIQTYYQPAHMQQMNTDRVYNDRPAVEKKTGSSARTKETLRKDKKGIPEERTRGVESGKPARKIKETVKKINRQEPL